MSEARTIEVKATLGSSRWNLCIDSLDDIPYDKLDKIKKSTKILVTVPPHMDNKTRSLIEERIENFYHARTLKPPRRINSGEMTDFLNEVNVDQAALKYLFERYWS